MWLKTNSGARHSICPEPLECRMLLSADLRIDDYSGNEISSVAFGLVSPGSTTSRTVYFDNGGPFSTADEAITITHFLVPTDVQVTDHATGQLYTFDSKLMIDPRTAKVLDFAFNSAGVQESDFERDISFETDEPGLSTGIFKLTGRIKDLTPVVSTNVSLDQDLGTVTGDVSLGGHAHFDTFPDSDGKYFTNVNAGVVQFTLADANYRADFTDLSDVTGKSIDVEIFSSNVVGGERVADVTSDVNATTASVEMSPGTYFAVGEYTGSSTSFDQDYLLPATFTALPPPAISVAFSGVSIDDSDLTPAAADGTDFGSVRVGDTEVVRNYTVTNSGGSTLRFGPVGVPSGFDVISGLPSSLTAGASADFQVGLPTSKAGTFRGNVTVPSGQADGPSFAFAVDGVVAGTPTPTPPSTPSTPTPPPTTTTPTPPATTPPATSSLSIPTATVAMPGGVAVVGQKTARGKITVTLANNLTFAYAGAVTLAISASTDGGTTRTQIGTLTKTLNLKPSAFKALKVKTSILSIPADGAYQIIVDASGPDVSATYNAGSVRIEKPRIEFASFVGTAAGPVVRFGRSATLILPLTNIGNVTAKGTITVSLSATGVAAGSFAIPFGAVIGKSSIKAGASGSLKLKVRIPPTSNTFLSGSYLLTARISASAVGAQITENSDILGSISFGVFE